MRCQESPLWCRLTYGEEFSKIKLSGHMYDTKCIFSAHIMCMVNTPFKIEIINVSCKMQIFWKLILVRIKL